MAERRIAQRDYDEVAQYIVDEQRRRADNPKRQALERQWAQVDRQVAMEPVKYAAAEGVSRKRLDARKWMPETELPLQAQSLEVLLADTTRLLFPQGNEWFTAHAAMTDEYAERVGERPLVHGDSFGTEPGPIDQETADILLHAALDHIHQSYNFRAHWARMIGEAVKYGTFAGQLRMAVPTVVSNEYRGKRIAKAKMPVLVPRTIKRTYLDDAAMHYMGTSQYVQPSTVTQYWQRHADIMESVAHGDSGWIAAEVARLDQKKIKTAAGHIEMLEFEGDVFMPRTRGGDIAITDRIWTVAVTGGPRVVRVREFAQPFRSTIHGVYQHDDADSPYGSSPLLKGYPLQYAASEAMNRLMQSAILNTEPPITYDDQDQVLTDSGGPLIHPGAQWPSGRPDKIKAVQIGDPAALLAMTQTLNFMYEALTAVNDPRRGGDVKSHTTALANDIQASRGVLRTEHFVNQLQVGAVLTWLHMEMEMARKALGQGQAVFVDQRGIRGFIDIAGAHIPDDAVFMVEGARGSLSKRDTRDQMIQAFQLLAQIEPLAIQLGGQPSDWSDIKRRILEEFNITDADTILRPAAQGTAGPPQGGPAVPPELAALMGGGQQQAA